MTAPLELKTSRARVRGVIVRDLEMLLERARAGEIESLLWFADYAASSRMSWGTSGAGSNRSEVAVIGRLEVLRHTFLDRFLRDT